MGELLPIQWRGGVCAVFCLAQRTVKLGSYFLDCNVLQVFVDGSVNCSSRYFALQACMMHTMRKRRVPCAKLLLVEPFQ